MKNSHTVTEISQFPIFWDEDWLKTAIREVDLRNMTSEQKLAYEMAVSANALVIKNEHKKVLAIKLETAKKLLALGVLTNLQIAQTLDIDEEFVLKLTNLK